MKQIVFGVHEAGNGHGIRFHKVEPMCAEWAVRAALFLGLL